MIYIKYKKKYMKRIKEEKPNKKNTIYNVSNNNKIK